MPLAKQIKLIELMNNLFESGFSLSEIIDFLDRANLTEKKFVDVMREELENGKNLSLILSKLRFSEAVVTQVSLAEMHGNISETMRLIEHNLRKINDVKKKLISVATYPIILLAFLVLIMLGMKNYLIPQVSDSSSTNIAVILVSNLPRIFLIILMITGLISFIIFLKIKLSRMLHNFQLAAKIPILSKFMKLYTTAYFSREWGVLISQGLDLRQILETSSAASSKIFSEVGREIGKELAIGSSFHESVKALGVFNKELPLMIEYGEMKGKLGKELMVYSDESWERFFQKIEQAMQLIQPLVFIFVALAIVLIYAAMLLPIYQNIDIQV